VREIAARFAMSLPAVSRHLKVVERAGHIARGCDGQKHPRRLNVKVRFPSGRVDTLSAWFILMTSSPKGGGFEIR